MMASRKAVLDKNKQQLLDSVNLSNKVYSNEELSILLEDVIKKQDTMLDKAYPVGSIYISYSATNPGSLFGGTWVAYASGRTLVGVDTSQTEFNSVGKIGGNKTHTLTVNEMPSHGHKLYEWVFIVARNGDTGFYSLNGGLTNGNLNHFGIDTDQNRNSVNTGGNQPHNNLQPYITVYMWRRTA